MITPTNAGNSPMYDPLAVQFMTQGQMGYMPDAQYLTPHDYGAFRTMPGMNMMGAMPQQQMSMWQAYTIQNQGKLPFSGPNSSPYIFDVYNPGAEQSWYQTMALRRWQDARSSMAGGVGDTMARVGVGAALGGIPGIAAGALMPDAFSPYMDRVRGMREIQGQSIPRIMTGPDVARGLGYGFSAPAARRIDASMREQGAQDYIYKQEDYRELYRLGMDQGLFDFDITSHQHEQTIKTLRNNVEVMSKLLGSTDFKELTKSMKRLMDMGMDPTFMASGTRLQAMSGFTSGMSVEAMSSAYGQPGAMAYSQAGLTPYLGSFAAMSSAAGLEISKRLGIVSPDELARMGGVSGFTQRNTQRQANFWGQERGFNNLLMASVLNGDMKVDPEKLRELTTGEFSLDAILNSANATSKNDYLGFELNRHSTKHDMMDTLGAGGQELVMYNLALKAGSRIVGSDRSVNERLSAGYRQFGWESDEAEFLAKMQADPKYFEARRDETQTTLRQMRESSLAETSYMDSPIRSAGVALRTTAERFGERMYGGYLERKAIKNQTEEDAARGLYTMGGRDSYKSFFVDRDTAAGISASRTNISEMAQMIGISPDKLQGNFDKYGEDFYRALDSGMPLKEALQKHMGLSEGIATTSLSNVEGLIEEAQFNRNKFKGFSTHDLSSFVANSYDTRKMMTFGEHMADNIWQLHGGEATGQWRMQFLLDTQTAFSDDNRGEGLERFIKKTQEMTGLSRDAIEHRLKNSRFNSFREIKSSSDLQEFLTGKMGYTESQAGGILDDTSSRMDFISALGSNDNLRASTTRELMERIDTDLTGQDNISDLHATQMKKLLQAGNTRTEAAIIAGAQRNSPFAASIGTIEKFKGMGRAGKIKKGSGEWGAALYQLKESLSAIGVPSGKLDILAEKILSGQELTSEEQALLDERDAAVGADIPDEFRELLREQGAGYGYTFGGHFRSEGGTSLFQDYSYTQGAASAGIKAGQLSQVQALKKRMKGEGVTLSSLRTKKGRDKILNQHKDDPMISAIVQQAEQLSAGNKSIGFGTLLEGINAQGIESLMQSDTSVDIGSGAPGKGAEKEAYEQLSNNLEGINRILELQTSTSRSVNTHVSIGNELSVRTIDTLDKLNGTLELLESKLA